MSATCRPQAARWKYSICSRRKTPSSLNTIAKGLGVGTTVAYRLVYTLTAEGFLHQDAASKQYMLGDKAMILGFCAVYRNDVKRIAHDLILAVL